MAIFHMPDYYADTGVPHRPLAVAVSEDMTALLPQRFRDCHHSCTCLLASAMACHGIVVESGPLGCGKASYQLAESNGKGP